jgi:hypothetical protein
LPIDRYAAFLHGRISFAEPAGFSPSRAPALRQPVL